MILILAEHDGIKLRQVTLEMVFAARALDLGTVTLLVFGADVGNVPIEAGQYADQVMVGQTDALEPMLAQVWAQAIAQVVTAQTTTSDKVNLILIAGSRAGREIAPRLAVRLDAPYLEDAIKLYAVPDGVRAVHYAFLARVTQTIEGLGSVIVATIKPNTQSLAGVLDREGDIFEIELELLTTRARVVSRTQEKVERVALSEANLVVTGGRGMGNSENFALIEALADALGAGVGATRAVVDAGWRPYAEQVGQTGKTVQPNAYIAVGVSGAVQHLSGMGKSKYIVAINKDAEAPIFKVADYGIIGDLNTIMPALIEAAQKVQD